MPFRGRGRGRGFGSGSNTRFTKRPKQGAGQGQKFGIESRSDRLVPGQGLNREDDGTAAAERFEEVRVQDEVDEQMGFARFESGKVGGEERKGWLVNMHQVSACGLGEPWGSVLSGHRYGHGKAHGG
jgi:DNA polymerase epsilon subunit 1